MLVALMGLAILAFAGCAALTDWPAPPVAPPALTPVQVECRDRVDQSFVSLVQDVLTEAEYDADLAGIVGQTSLCAVRTAVQRVIDQDSSAPDVLRNAHDWLAAHQPRPPGMVSI